MGCTLGLWFSGCFFSTDVDWLTFCELGIWGFWKDNVGLWISGDLDITFSLINRCLPGTFFKPALLNPLLIGIFVTNWGWFIKVVTGNWDNIFAAFSDLIWESEGLSWQFMFPTVIPAFCARDLV